MSDLEMLRIYEAQEPSLVLRRFVDVSKFRHLIEDRALYFAPACAFEDELEGHYTDHDHKLWDDQLRDWHVSDLWRKIARQAKKTVATSNQQAVVISCWTQNTTDNSRMWREYGRSDESVAIETTLQKFRMCVGREFLFIPVKYIDFEISSIPKDHSLQPYFFKRLNYSWEQEVRVTGSMEIGKRIGSPRIVPIDIESFIRRIVISPTAPPGFRERISKLIGSTCPTIPVEPVGSAE